jgi:uncharacterized protein YjbI with pentapeptide repeats
MVTPQRIVGVAVIIGICSLAIAVVRSNGWGFEDKDLFDWLEVFIFPLALGLGLPWLTSTQRAQREREQSIEVAQRERELEIENQRAQDRTLQAYLDQMANLLLEPRLREEQPAEDVRAVARARTLVALNSVDGYRKRSIIEFLREALLIHKNNTIIDLVNANLQDGNFVEIDLADTNLTGANLTAADSRSANLSGAILSEANLSEANLSKADLSEADLSFANLGEANLTDANLSGANLEGATMPDGSTHE